MESVPSNTITKRNDEGNNEEAITNHKPSKLPKIAINASRSRGELKLIQHLVEKNKGFGWKMAYGLEGNVMWSGMAIPWEETYIACEMHLNRIPGAADISEKKLTGFYLNKFQEYFPENYDFYPKTFLLPENTQELQEYMKSNPNKTFIAKPTAGCQGDGIILFKKFQDLPSSPYSNAFKDIVVQEYIDNPLLIRGKKFDLRMYVLISNVKPMIAFLNEEGLARFCTKDYQKPNSSNLRDLYMHLTNYSLNKLSPNYKYTEECIEINEGTKRTFTSFWKSVEKEGYDKNKIMENIKDLIKKLLISLEPYLQFSYNVAYEGKDDGKCFHVLGIDILLDDELKPWLLEINANPSMCIDFEEHSDEKKKPVSVICPVDLFVKEKVMEDAILISRKKPAKQKELTKYGSFELIYNGEGSSDYGMAIFKEILEIFGKLSGAKFKTGLTSGKFIKLASLPNMTSSGLTKADYDILYKKLVQNSADKQMDFATFVQALETLAEKLIKDMNATNKNQHMSVFIHSILSNL